MCSYHLLNNRAVLHLSDCDAANFLLRITTNVIPKDGEAKYSMILNPKGRFLFDFFLINNRNNFFIDCSASIKNDLLSKLNMFKLRSKVKISDVSDCYSIIYSQSYLCDSDLYNLNLEATKVLIQYQDPRFNQMGFRLLTNKFNSYNLVTSNIDLYLVDKYKFAIPDGEIDLQSNKAIPIEYGANILNAISYSKGCYIGQELISRIRSQGIVRKKIYHATSNENLLGILHQTPVMHNGSIIGYWCSGHYTQGIALIRESDEHQNLSQQEITVSDIKIKLSIPPWQTTLS
ncbi:glycine cleavage T-C-terminal barrel domain protein [Orientia chuto str. Dubai]|uniref:Glycine cleavage T-C-terminal barrel domain protein n=1 Tax=Orientia chuto str. Dubai TaxID=1359168 RepID=A0A0F3MH54_9RICK|nr:folate-binding protein YgfZ [Candidatus Orientia mediorientalis]KJV55070.1 glycine cleavage T-C-terminal barrel domain protein [Orientia chuto str. Dubai]